MGEKGNTAALVAAGSSLEGSVVGAGHDVLVDASEALKDKIIDHAADAAVIAGTERLRRTDEESGEPIEDSEAT